MKGPPGKPYCCYCKRELSPSNSGRSTAFTLDHVKAESLGGWKRVPCCKKCNHLKDDLAMSDWFWFIQNHPRWWKLYRGPEDVKVTIRAYRFEQAMKRKAGA